AVDQGAGTTPKPVSAAVTGLQPGIPYHFRLVTSSNGGTGYGPEQAFITPAAEAPRFAVANGGDLGEAKTVTEYAARASGNTAPISTISGNATGLDAPAGIVQDNAGHLFVANAAANSVTEYAVGASGDAAPVKTIVG